MSVPVLFDKKEDCCGCGACLSACAKDAITMTFDEYGCEYPAINDSLCVNCGMCKRVCAYQGENEFYAPKSVYASVSTSTDVMESASGGVFASISSEFINHSKHTVVGAVLDNTDGKITPIHQTANSIDKLKKLWNSKYVQSDTSKIFGEVMALLDNEESVLFSGTPCQVSALKSYLGKDYENLFTIDIICHGVPGRQMFFDYMDFLSKKLGTVKEYLFRDKKHGLTFVSRAECEKNGREKSVYIHFGESAYFTYFLNGDTYRDCCYKCKYAQGNRVGDITIGDYWGIKAQHPELFQNGNSEFDLHKGISCILVNTQQGEKLLKLYGNGLSLYESEFEKVANENFQLSHPIKPKDNRDEILNAYKNGGYDKMNTLYKNQVGAVAIAISKIKGRTPLWIKKLLKK